MPDKANPGSNAALKLGCKCPVLDNDRGRGIPWLRDDGLDPNEHPSFNVNTGCPLHGLPASNAETLSLKGAAGESRVPSKEKAVNNDPRSAKNARGSGKGRESFPCTGNPTA